MPPRPKFTKEEVISAALEIVRAQGADALTARELGARLGASARPIFTLFKSMEEVKAGVLERGMAFFSALQKEELAKGKYPPYKAIGMAYIRLAAEEKRLFQLLFMRDRTGEAPGEPDPVVGTVIKQTGLSEEEARRFHAEMWVCVHGIAAMLATSYLEWDHQEISVMLTDLYEGLKGRYQHE